MWGVSGSVSVAEPCANDAPVVVNPLKYLPQEVPYCGREPGYGLNPTTCDGPGYVFFGKGSKWTVKQVNANEHIECSTAGFGCDPAPNEEKLCYRLQVQLNWSGWHAKPGATLGLCQGDCDSDVQCADELYCYHNVGMNGPPPGCSGSDGSNSNWADYCFLIPPPTRELTWLSWHQTGGLGACQGDCDTDDQCVGNLKCFHQSFHKDGHSLYGKTVPVPGCTGYVEISDYDDPTCSQCVGDYCYDPTSTNSFADRSGSEYFDDEQLIDEDDDEEEDEEEHSVDDFIPLILGAASCAVVVAGAVALVVTMKKRTAAKEAEIKACDAVHVPDVSEVVAGTKQVTVADVGATAVVEE